MTGIDFEIAKKNLFIKDIYIHKNQVDCSEDFDRRKVNSTAHLCQHFNGCERIVVFRVDDAEVVGDDEDHFLYRFYYSAGVRLIDEVGEGGDSDIENEDVLVEIQATFDVVYTSKIEIPNDQVEVYAERNVRYHVWPFWREFVFSSCARVGVSPPIEIPAYLIPRGAKKVVL